MIADSKLLLNRGRIWAAERLGIRPDSSARDFSVALLSRVEEDDFVPPLVVRQAWEVAVGKQASEPFPLDELLEDELHSDVENFARQFFEMPVPDRVRAWRQLFEQAASWPRLKARLTNLRPGLQVEFPAVSAKNPHAQELIASARELFILPPAQRALRRREILRQSLQTQLRPWQNAARTIRWRYRSIAALSPDLILSLAASRRTIARARRNYTLRLSAPAPKTTGMRRRVSTAWLVVVLVIFVVVGISIFDDHRPTIQRDYNQRMTDHELLEYDFNSSPPTPLPAPSVEELNSEQLREAIARFKKTQQLDRDPALFPTSPPSPRTTSPEKSAPPPELPAGARP